jgi:4-amino-4-deoxychorismate lyase
VELFALHNGIPMAVVSVTNRGFAYGDGLFATIKISDGHPQFLSEHLQRIRRDCVRLNINLDNVALEREIISLLSAQLMSTPTRFLTTPTQFLTTHNRGILKVVITRKSNNQRGYAAAPRAAGERFLLFYPLQPTDDVRARDGVAVHLCRQHLSEQHALAGIKHLNRLEQVLARAEWFDSAIAEGLMLDGAGRLIEGTMSNVFLVRSGCVTTPRLHRCGVVGVLRTVIMQQLSARCAPVVEDDLTLDDLYAADEVFLSNSVIGIWPVRKIECIHKAVGDVTIAFQTELNQLIAAHTHCR